MTGRREEQVLDVIFASQQFEVNVDDTGRDVRSLIAKSLQKLSEQRSVYTKV